ncbi:2-hydroxychromene-2-carboxylate isomerase [Parerythrobacter aestuarii]|uniref:2-hydroxychromene-2-carboxylate isomerase n=1 Tax=Parerythrobacter aestuarii TaxID=3020909 RepID=UPI0024DE27FD|nr:2-hydroxychromene-2-carboxylate isomerase [Parerythrobacter aestuarii]
MAVPVDFFFDLSSPWTRLAFHNFQRMPEFSLTSTRWRPFLVGGVFNAVNPRVYEAREGDQTRMLLGFGWLKEWARLADLPMNFPSEHHPVKSVHAMRCCCVLEDDQPSLLRFAEAAFHAYFADQRNLDDPAELAAIADAIGMDGAKLLERASSQPVKDLLRANTQEAIDHGAFGSPTIFVGRESMYFGNDQLPLVAQRIRELAEA